MRNKTFNIGDKVWMLTIVGHSLLEQNNGRKEITINVNVIVAVKK